MFPYLASVKDFLNGSEDPENFSKMLEKRVNASCWGIKRDADGNEESWTVGDSEVVSWKNSLCVFVRDVLKECSPDLAVGIEYFTERDEAGRVDLMLAGKDKDGKAKVLVIELKQWSKVEKDPVDPKYCIPCKIVEGEPEERYSRKAHPALSLERYIKSIKDHNEAKDIQFIPVIYVHNMSKSNDKLDLSCGKKAKVFYKDETKKFTGYIAEELQGTASYKENKEIYSRIRKGYESIDISLLADLFHKYDKIETIESNYNEIVSYLRPDQSCFLNRIEQFLSDGKKHVVILRGGPGSGKTVLSLLIRARIRINNYYRKIDGKEYENCLVVYEGTAPINKLNEEISKRQGFGILTVYSADLSKTIKEAKKNYKYLIFDEFHRYKGTDQKDPQKELIDMVNSVSGTVVLLLDEKQKVYNTDLGGEILAKVKEKLEKTVGKENVHEYKLRSQFRCNSDDGYISWVEAKLKMRNDDPVKAADLDFVPGFIDKDELKKLIRDGKDGWVIVTSIKDNLDDQDLTGTGITKFKGKHGLIKADGEPDAGFWADVHGVEYDNVLVLIGKDLTYDMLDKTDEDTVITKNRYRMLLTRGMKNCLIYCADERLRRHFEEE